LGQAIATLSDFEVYPSVTVQTCQLVFIDKLIGDVQDFDANVFGLGHRSIQVEVLKVNAAKKGSFSRDRGSGGKNVIFSNGPNSTSECLKLLY
jgi:hypothetical protein